VKSVPKIGKRESFYQKFRVFFFFVHAKVSGLEYQSIRPIECQSKVDYIKYMFMKLR